MWYMEFGVNTKYVLGLPWAPQIDFSMKKKPKDYDHHQPAEAPSLGLTAVKDSILKTKQKTFPYKKIKGTYWESYNKVMRKSWESQDKVCNWSGVVDFVLRKSRQSLQLHSSCRLCRHVCSFLCSTNLSELRCHFMRKKQEAQWPWIWLSGKRPWYKLNNCFSCVQV